MGRKKQKRSRKETSLYHSTKHIWSLIEKEGPVPIRTLAAQTCKRRCYDVIAVLEAIGKIERTEDGLIQVAEPLFNDEEIDCLIFSCQI